MNLSRRSFIRLSGAAPAAAISASPVGQASLLPDFLIGSDGLPVEWLRQGHREKIKKFKKTKFDRFLRSKPPDLIANFLAGKTTWDSDCVLALSDTDFFWFYQAITEARSDVNIQHYLSDEALAYSLGDLNDETSDMHGHIQTAIKFREIISRLGDDTLTFGQVRQNLRLCFKSLVEKFAAEPDIFKGGLYYDAYQNIDHFRVIIHRENKADQEFWEKEISDATTETLEQNFEGFVAESWRKEEEKRQAQRDYDVQRKKERKSAEAEKRDAQIREKIANPDKRDPYIARISKLEVDGENLYFLEGGCSKKILTKVDWYYFALSLDINAKPSDIKMQFEGAVLEVNNPKIIAHIEAQIKKSPKSGEGRVRFPNRRDGIDLNHCDP